MALAAGAATRRHTAGTDARSGFPACERSQSATDAHKLAARVFCGRFRRRRTRGPAGRRFYIHARQPAGVRRAAKRAPILSAHLFRQPLCCSAAADGARGSTQGSSPAAGRLRRDCAARFPARSPIRSFSSGDEITPRLSAKDLRRKRNWRARRALVSHHHAPERTTIRRRRVPSEETGQLACAIRNGC